MSANINNFTFLTLLLIQNSMQVESSEGSPLSNADMKDCDDK